MTVQRSHPLQAWGEGPPRGAASRAGGGDGTPTEGQAGVEISLQREEGVPLLGRPGGTTVPVQGQREQGQETRGDFKSKQPQDHTRY